MHVRAALRHALQWTERIVLGSAAVLLCLLIGLVLANVIGRYGFNSSIIWAPEAAQWLYIAIIFLAVPLAHRHQKHMKIGLLSEKFSGLSRRMTDLGADTVTAYATWMLLFGSADILGMLGGTNHVLGLPVWVKFSVIPASCILGLIYLALKKIEDDTDVLTSVLSIICGGVVAWLLGPGNILSLSGLDPVWVLFVGFGGALLLGCPVVFAMMASVFLANAAGGTLPTAAAVQTMVNGSSKFLLLAIPFFITAGVLMNVGGLTQRLIDFANSLVGHMRGGLAHVNILSSGLYAGISGSSYSEAALGAKLLVPQMIRHGYPAGFSCALTAASATLPNVIPPSIALLLLAATANLSVGALWLAGIIPGLLMAISLMMCVAWLARRKSFGASIVKSERLGRRYALFQAIPVLALAIIVLGGIRFGIVTPTEAGVLAVAYSWFLGMAVYRAYSFSGFWNAIKTATVDAALIGLLIGAAGPFAFILVTEQVPQDLAAWLGDIADSRLLLLLLANLLMLLFGMFLDIGASVLILTPLLMPIMVTQGVDPIHFGVVIVVNLMLGGLTPPVGMLAFVTSTVSGVPTVAIFRAMLPFLLALIVALVLITYVPTLSLALNAVLS